MTYLRPPSPRLIAGVTLLVVLLTVGCSQSNGYKTLKVSSKIDSNQSLEPSEQMYLLAVIENKQKNGLKLSLKELRFLYEIDELIVSPNVERDPRINELIAMRNVKEDLSLIFEVPQEKISTTKSEVLSGQSGYHFGDLDLNELRSAKGITLPLRVVNGDLDLSGLESAEGLTLPEAVNGNV